MHRAPLAGIPIARGLMVKGMAAQMLGACESLAASGPVADMRLHEGSLYASQQRCCHVWRKLCMLYTARLAGRSRRDKLGKHPRMTGCGGQLYLPSIINSRLSIGAIAIRYVIIPG